MIEFRVFCHSLKLLEFGLTDFIWHHVVRCTFPCSNMLRLACSVLPFRHQV